RDRGRAADPRHPTGRVRRHRRAPRRRRVLCVRGGPGRALRRPARGRPISLPGHRQPLRDRTRTGRRHEAQHPDAARRRRRRVLRGVAGGRGLSRAREARARAVSVRRRLARRRSDHASALYGGRSRSRGRAAARDRRALRRRARARDGRRRLRSAQSRARVDARRRRARRSVRDASSVSRGDEMASDSRSRNMVSDTFFADDASLFAAIDAAARRQEAHVELIASENYVSRAVLAAQGSVLTNKYADGYPGRRTYRGCEHVDAVEALAIERAKGLFGVGYANVQPYSGSQANMAAYLALLEPGDTVLAMRPDHGGHRTHGDAANFSGKLYRVEHYGVDPRT